MIKSTTDKGKWGETIAREYLEKKNYKIISTNWRAERGDIDIIAIDNSCLVFVEVKSGYTEKFGPPELRITHGKKRQLYKLASLFLEKMQDSEIKNDSYRFDAVIVDGYPDNFKIRHYENAFFF
ncbi:MAG: YraN family protein [Calditrichota bacterium]